jgi:hypothetical protein
MLGPAINGSLPAVELLDGWSGVLSPHLTGVLGLKQRMVCGGKA